MKNASKILSTLFALFVIAFAGRASANLVNNGGFETGDFNGWTQGGNTSQTFVSNQPNTGKFAAWLEGAGSEGSLSQTLATSAGSSYNLSFFLGTPDHGDKGPGGISGGLSSVEFQVFWNGVMIFDTMSQPPAGYTAHTFNLLATSASTVLQFVFRNDPSYFLLDDVSVNQVGGSSVPEDFSTLWLALPLLGMVGFARLRQKELCPAV